MKIELNGEYVVILSTAPNLEVAQSLSRNLVTSGLAACVNIVPGVESIYRWEGKVESGQELLLIIKTVASRQSQIFAALDQQHPYEVPACFVLPVQGGSEKYLQWIAASAGKDCDSLG